MLTTTWTHRMPTLGRAGIYARKGRGASMGRVFARVRDIQAMSVTLKKGET